MSPPTLLSVSPPFLAEPGRCEASIAMPPLLVVSASIAGAAR
jgi:hypothetical protein